MLAARPDPYGLGAIPAIPTWIPDPEEGGHALRLLTPKSRARTHSIHDNQPILSRADKDDVWIHPAYATARGITDCQRVRVFNHPCATVLPARVTDRIAPVVAANNINYRRPLTWPNDILVELYVDRLGTSSVTIGHRIVDQDGVLYCDGNVVVVWMDTHTGKSAPLPDAVRNASV